MRPFEYANPNAREQAAGLLQKNWGPVEVLAGGTDLLSLMKDDVVHPERLVNIKDIPEMRGVVFGPRAGLRVGALTTIQEFADHSQVRLHYPVLARAANDAASPQIRNMATLGGNMCQRPRCWYFRNGFGLLALDASGKSMVLEGDNRYHAILGNAGPAYFVSPSSLAPALIAHGAKIRLYGARGARELQLAAFFKIPKSENEREHDLAPDEIVTDLLVPPTPGLSFGHYEVRQKEAFDWPLGTASVALQLEGRTVRKATVVLGHVAPIPWVSEEAAQALTGKAVSEQTADAAGQAAVAKAKALSRNGYKIQLARVAVKRAVLQAAKGGQA